MKLNLICRSVACVLLSALCAAAASSKAAASKPNVLVILADDMGFSDPGCYGGEIQTPNLDRLAAGGLRYTQFYNTARCWPTRGALLTGYYAQQIRRDALPQLGGGSAGIRPSWAMLLPQALKPAGYRTYHSGKWHVDGPVLKGGFDESYSLNDHNHYFYPKEHTLNDEPLPAVKPGDGYYCTTAIAEHAIKMLAGHQQAHQAEPFFLYLAFTSPHFPLQAKAEDIAVYRDRYQAGWDALRQERLHRLRKLNIVDGDLPPLDPGTLPTWNLPLAGLQEKIGPGEVSQAVPWNTLNAEQKKFQPIKMAIHAAMVHRMDIEIGRVLDQLKKMGALDNTVIFFFSDNGASAEQIIRGDGHDPKAAPGSGQTFLCLGPAWGSAANTPFRLYKVWVNEGGISTPLIVHWPQGINARGELRRNPGHVVDLAPTILELTGAKWPDAPAGSHSPARPGQSLVPTFAKDNTVEHQSFWWLHNGNRAIRMGDWKLVAVKDKDWELFNLREDRTETHNLAAKNPEKVKQLAAEWERQLKEYETQVAKEPETAVPARKAKKGQKKKAQEN